MVYCWSIRMDFSMDLIGIFVAFKFYKISPDPAKCLDEEGGSKSGSGDQGISN